MVSLLSLIVIVSLSILVTKVATIALNHTGLSKESAAFQARSAFTGVGFTTSEAEKVINHPVRRKIIMTLMLVGNAGIISAVASLMLTFIDTSQGGSVMDWPLRLGILFVSMILLWFLATSKAFDRYLRKVVKNALKKFTKLDVKDYAELLHLSGEYEISEVKVEAQDWIANKILADLRLRDEGANLISIKRSDGTYVGLPHGETEVLPGDVLVLYGRESVLKQLDTRQSGKQGDDEHEVAVKEELKRQVIEEDDKTTARREHLIEEED